MEKKKTKKKSTPKRPVGRPTKEKTYSIITPRQEKGLPPYTPTNPQCIKVRELYPDPQEFYDEDKKKRAENPPSYLELITEYRKKVGRPGDYHPILCDVIIDIARECDPFELAPIICWELDIGRGILNNWLFEHPEFRSAMDVARTFWKRNLDKYAIEKKIDYRFYKTFVYQVTQQIIEPPEKVDHSFGFLKLEQLHKLNEDFHKIKKATLYSDDQTPEQEAEMMQIIGD